MGAPMTQTPAEPPSSVPDLQEQLRDVGYLADRGLATATLISLRLGRPLLLEGEVGVGKTELAKCLAQLTGRELIRLQCYEGIDTHQALYEWDYARQMLHVRALSERELTDSATVGGLYAEEFLLERPLLQAVRVQAPDVAEALTRKVVDAVHRLRDLDLAKPPGVAETIDWVEALGAIGADNLDGETAIDTLGSVIKDRDDLEFVSSGIDRVVPDA